MITYLFGTNKPCLWVNIVLYNNALGQGNLFIYWSLQYWFKSDPALCYANCDKKLPSLRDWYTILRWDSIRRPISNYQFELDSALTVQATTAGWGYYFIVLARRCLKGVPYEVYFDQLLGASHTWKLEQNFLMAVFQTFLFFSAVLHLFCHHTAI